MGADIHLVLERKHKGRWIGLHAFDSKIFDATSVTGYHFFHACERNYVRFAALAGVRSHGPAPKGYPADISDLAQMMIEQWDSDGHSHTWYYLDEAARIFKETERGEVKTKDELSRAVAAVAEGYDVYMRRMSHYFGVEWHVEDSTNEERLAKAKELANEHRLIIWFDN